MANWNKNSTAVKGLEWFVVTSGSVALDTSSKMAAMSMDATVSEAITSISIANSGIAKRGGIYAVEVYDNETGVPANVTGAMASPNADFSVGGWSNQSGGTTNLYQAIDDPFLDTTDYIKTSATSPTTYRGRFSVPSLTGKRILSVSLVANAAVGPTGVLSAGLNIGGVDYLGFVSGPGPARDLRKAWYYNPATKKPWTIADVAAFATTDEWYATANVTAGVWAAVAINMAYLAVQYCDENRLAVGILDDTASGLTVGAPATPYWNTATVTTPTGGTWTKDATGQHLYTVRRISTVGTMSVPWLDSGAAAPIGSGWSPTLDPTLGYITSMGSRLTRMMPCVPNLAGPTASVDGQPYNREAFAPVYLFQDAQQEFSAAAAAQYGVIRVMVQPGNADMIITCRRRSDNAQLGGAYTLTAAAASALPADSEGWRLVQVQLPSAATLAAATQYYLNFSAGVVTGASWNIKVADSFAGPGNVATFGGTTDIATWTSVDVPNADLIATISTIPTAPAGMSAALGAQTVAETLCCVDEIARADVSWSATALGGSFLRYEIQRSEDGGTTWFAVGTVSAEATTQFSDYEAPRGVAVSYRIRVVRTDLAFSAWSVSGTVTKPRTDNALYLVSNFAPSLNVAYDYRPVRDYDFNENEERVTRAVYLRDYQLGFNPIEYRGTTAHYTLLVGLDDKVPPGGGLGFAAFAPLRTIARAQLPYVCVVDADGNRLYATLFVPRGEQDESGGRRGQYITEIAATEVAAVPYPVSA